VLQTKDEPPSPDEDRPPWHWAPIGAVATFLVWLPLAALAESLTAGTTAGEPATSGVFRLSAQALACFAGAFAGGLLVGRLGGKAGRKEATLSGLLASAIAWLIALSQSDPSSAFMWLVWCLLLVILATIGGAAALLGGRLGLRLRPPRPHGGPPE